MTSVVVNDTPGPTYTWDASNWQWTDARAGKTWATGHQSAYDMQVGEPFTVAEAGSKAVTKAFNESFAIAESRRFEIVKSILEAFNINENHVDLIAYVLRVFETLGIAENLSKQYQLPIAESFTVTESGFEKNFTLAINEVVDFAESFGRTVAYKRSFSEGLGIAESLSKAITLNKNEAFGLFEEYLRRGNAVISDMILATGDITLQDFKDVIDAGHAPGYTPFRDFIPGDYEYQEAIFRAVLESINSDRARLTALKVTVDVPDVFESGSATITNASTGIRVDFTRTFHIIPEITVTLKGGTVIAIPDVISQDLTGFTGILTDPTTSNRVTGTFTWAAHGY